MSKTTTELVIGSGSYVSGEPVEGGFCVAKGAKESRKTEKQKSRKFGARKSDAGGAADIYVDANDWPGVVRAVGDLTGDVKKVTGAKVTVKHDEKAIGENTIVVGTIGKSAAIDRLIAEKKIDVTGIAGKWESFLIQVVEDSTAMGDNDGAEDGSTPTRRRGRRRPPPKGEEMRLVIAGSDKRGTIFGVYDLCEQMGVSPWWWWADVPAKKSEAIYVKPGRYVRGEAGVRYRGIFLNDEQPALTNWVNEKYGGYKSGFYVRVFELLLRLKANYLWPAMWYSAFNEDDPLNAKLADEWGIVMGTSHHEPMLRAQQEWKRHGSGAWDYVKNEKVLYEFWDEGMKRNKDFESIITLGMRGDGDEPMSEEANTALLQRIVSDQRKIIGERVNKDVSKVPQLWALYKEVQEYFERGMRVPDDVTLLWCDDNWGNNRRLPTEEERGRSGGAGIYYHFDYVGGPRSYKWINTTQIAKVWEQMNLAYEYGADRIWIVNVGDLKPMEFVIDFFLRMAWRPESFTGNAPRRLAEDSSSSGLSKTQGNAEDGYSLGFVARSLWEYTVGFAAQQFGEKYAEEIAEILAKYTKWNARRKHELLEPGTFSFVNYGEAERVLGEWKEILEKAERIQKKLPKEMRDAFFQLVLHPVKASAIVNEMLITAGRNALYAGQGRVSANDLPARVRELFKQDAELTEEYHEIAGGKWNHMMDQTHLGYTFWNQPHRNVMPGVTEIIASKEGAMGVAYEGSVICPWPGMPGEAKLPGFDVFNKPRRWVDVFNRGLKGFEFRVEVSEKWIKVSKKKGRVKKEERLWVEVDWKKVPKGEASGYVRVARKDTGDSAISIKVTAFNMHEPGKDFRGFVEGDGYVCMEAEHYTKKTGANGVEWEKVEDLGRTGSAMSVFPVTARSADPGAGARLEYEMYVYHGGKVEVEAVVGSTLNFVPGRGLRYAVAFDEAEPQVVDVLADGSQRAWEESVKDGVRVSKSTHVLGGPGKHVLKVWMVDAGVVLQRVVVNVGGVRVSYLGPVESYRNSKIDEDKCPAASSGEHHFEFVRKYDLADTERMTGERRVADYICRHCGKRATFDYIDYQDTSPM